MTLHVFNPEHDIALASNKENFTAPHAARSLRYCLSFLPVLWAEEGDWILVEDAQQAIRSARKHKYRCDHVRFLTREALTEMLQVLPARKQFEVDVWGWDLAIRKELLDCGVPARVLPPKSHITELRKLSNRQTSVKMLKKIDIWFSKRPKNKFHNCTIGKSFIVESLDEVKMMRKQLGDIVVKAPWSSSGRGVKYITTQLNTSQKGWIENTIKEQGSIIVEPYYKKVLDFGMEFTIHNGGIVIYEGLSIFYTKGTTWLGNIVSTEEDKREMLSKYLNLHFLDEVRDQWKVLLKTLCKGRYIGKLGIDMMIVPNEEGKGFYLHPCVEINFRRTMGHVALALTPLSP